MPEYNVHHTGYVSHVETVEADSPEEAIASSEVGSVSLCHQCSREWDSGGDPEVFTVTDADGETVWEQAPAPQPVVDREALVALLVQHKVFTWMPMSTKKLDEGLGDLADAVLALINGTTN